MCLFTLDRLLAGTRSDFGLCAGGMWLGAIRFQHQLLEGFFAWLIPKWINQLQEPIFIFQLTMRRVLVMTGYP